jgi:hypothetical protein
MAAGAEIEVDVYSGQPNPRGTLTAAQTAELLAAVQAAPLADPPIGAPGLGYRGYVVRPVGGPTLRVHGGLIRDESSGETRLDVGRRLERRLADWAAPFVPPRMASWLRDAE